VAVSSEPGHNMVKIITSSARKLVPGHPTTSPDSLVSSRLDCDDPTTHNQYHTGEDVIVIGMGINVTAGGEI